MTPKPNRKSKVSTNKRGREIEQESPSSPPPAPKKRVDMISWGPSNNETNETKSQTEGKIRFEISVAIRTLENPDEATPPPRVTHKYCAFHDRKGHATEECQAALRSQNESKKTTEENGEEEEEPVTPKSNRKYKVPINKKSREIEQESPSSPPPAPKKRVDMISWGPSNNATNETKSQTEGKIRFEISVAIRTLENIDEATPPPCVTQTLIKSSVAVNSANKRDKTS
ncbi:hypothetical protein F2Q69_00030656 [Brassica cretica]|uniref:Uncharacterized protein n=1 Tax=Brassica cretica TaxID=69181 RepID=A0A8S9S848_BRACR|nr:hypothetical protein F2Q69_00030656 [Brassica cretica]